MATTFKMFDSDNSKTLNLKEISEKFGMSGIGSHLDSKIWDQIIEKVDKNHDGLVNIIIYYIRYHLVNSKI